MGRGMPQKGGGTERKEERLRKEMSHKVASGHQGSWNPHGMLWALALIVQKGLGSYPYGLEEPNPLALWSRGSRPRYPESK